VPGLGDLNELVAASRDVAKIMLEAVQDFRLKILLQMARGTTKRLIKLHSKLKLAFPRSAGTRPCYA
jgi:hypothetical protein